jgi:hypothetical protein
LVNVAAGRLVEPIPHIRSCIQFRQDRLRRGSSPLSLPRSSQYTRHKVQVKQVDGHELSALSVCSMKQSDYFKQTVYIGRISTHNTTSKVASSLHSTVHFNLCLRNILSHTGIKPPSPQCTGIETALLDKDLLSAVTIPAGGKWSFTAPGHCRKRH